ncbi:MAG TPA: NIPSNAP family protein [Opitutaceae bacterium]|nr:NIPSNAP family protein [Opitutaceae bacterium]
MPRRAFPRLVAGLFLAGVTAALAQPAAPVYELRVYTAAEGRMPALLTRFRDHTCRLFEKHGMANVGYWVPADPAKDGDRLFYVLRHASRDAAAKSWDAFRADPGWIGVRTASEAAAGGRLVSAVESTLLAPTDYSPAPAPYAGPERLFELRTYTTPEGKLPALDARFRDHTMALFARHGMTNLPYWHPLDADKGAGRTLIYFVAHRNREAADKAWAGFRDDPEWNRVRTESEKDGRLTAAGGVKSVYLVPTDFSPLR